MFPTWDSDLFQLINQAHQPWLDQPMVIISGKLTWIPLYAFLIYLLYKEHKSKVWKTILYLISTVIFADQVSSSILKPLFKRLRPCHVEAFQSWIHLPDGCGGLYGFCSSHSANAFAVAIGFYLVTKNRLMGTILIVWATLIAYSRIYLGAHYPLDVIMGAIVGGIGSFTLFQAYAKLTKKS
jgi:undecaprenyl-diphosphatase